ncbi:MAG: cobalamin B12-binding domain-containing protein [Deltaproteobacteria bacterium]|nr:cobalamin B12-binding domain-containing protein [Deltaproteobacteria bacterium]
MGKAIRVLVAKPGLDGHDVGAKVVAQALREAGMEVVDTGLRQTPEAIARTALQEAVDVVGLSILSGAHLQLCAEVKKALDHEQVDDVVLMVGGVIPDRDRAALEQLGFSGVFAFGSHLDDVVRFIKEKVP